jgi:ATP-dependent protease ClpP protease subunit
MATHEINIYGDIVPFKWMNDGSEFDRADLNNAIDNLDLQEGDELIYNINTFGGCTTTAFSMYNKLKRVKNEKKVTLTSRADGYCASSGVILLLAGDKKIGNKYLKPFVHNAWTWAMGDKNETKKAFEELDKVDNEIAELYATETTMSKDLALQIMNESRDLTVDECLQYGFYTELENVQIVENSIIFNSINKRNSQFRNNNNMSEKNEKQKKDLWTQIENFFSGGKASNKIMFTAENMELDFYELEEDAMPEIGSKARYDNKAAGESNGGVYIMASGETYTFVGEELTSIEPKAEENAFEAENISLKEDVVNLKTEIENLKAEKETLNKRFTEAESIIKNFKELEAPKDKDDAREPNGKEKETEVSKVKSAIGNLKKTK